jgi:hypothetical protein
MSRDLRQYNQKTIKRLVIGFILLVFVVGDGLIFLLYGYQAGITGLLCLIGAMIPVSLVVLFLKIAENVANRQE